MLNANPAMAKADYASDDNADRCFLIYVTKCQADAPIYHVFTL